MKVLTIDNGVLKEVNATAGLSGYIPFYEADGAFSPIPLTGDAKIPFFVSDGTQKDIPTI